MSSRLSPSTLRERAKARGEPGWLADARGEAYERYTRIETPRWRRTDLPAPDVDALATALFHTTPPPLPSAPRQEGLIRLPLAEAAREHEHLVRPLIQTAPAADKWETLQMALWNAGTFLHVEAGREIEAPLLLSEPHPKAGALLHDVVVLGRTSKASLLQRASGTGAGGLVLHGLEMHLHDGANLALSTLQDAQAGSLLLTTKRAHVARDARLTWVDGQFGGGTLVALHENRLEGPGAGVRYLGAFFGAQGQHMDITTGALHLAPHTQSQLDMKGALTDDGYAVNYSIVNIGPNAPNASGHQHQETLLLSDRARADAIPKLDVENNDVSASHGATVGQVDPDQLFYLRARGLGELAAKRLIVQGFFDPLLREIPMEDVREEIARTLVGRLRE